jgi:hypothetical protein
MTALRALLVLAGAAHVVAQPAAGQFEHVGSTLVSGMMARLARPCGPAEAHALL